MADKRKIRIAIVEDDARLRELYSTVLEAFGFHVESFAEARDFPLERLEEFDLAFVDLKFRGMSGLGLVGHARGLLRCVVVTGATNLIHEAYLLPACCFVLLKPVNLMALVKAVELALVMELS